MIATRTHARAQCTQEILFTPKSNTGFLVRRDIRRVERPERRCQRMPTGKQFASMFSVGMAALTAGSAVDMFALLQLWFDRSLPCRQRKRGRKQQPRRESKTNDRNMHDSRYFSSLR